MSVRRRQRAQVRDRQRCAPADRASRACPAKGARGAAIRPVRTDRSTTSRNLPAYARSRRIGAVQRAGHSVATATAEPPEEPPDVNARIERIARRSAHADLCTPRQNRIPALVDSPMITAPVCRSLDHKLVLIRHLVLEQQRSSTSQTLVVGGSFTAPNAMQSPIDRLPRRMRRPDGVTIGIDGNGAERRASCAAMREMSLKHSTCGNLMPRQSPLARVVAVNSQRLARPSWSKNARTSLGNDDSTRHGICLPVDSSEECIHG